MDEKTNILINKYIMNEEWENAKLILEDIFTKMPDDHWIITQLAEVNYEMHNYDLALQLAEKAILLAPNCPLVINDYANMLYIHENYSESINLWKRLLKKGAKRIAKDECGEGINAAVSLLNDCRFRIAVAYQHINDIKSAIHYLKLHLKNRRRGIFSNFTKSEVLKRIEKLNAAT